VTGFLVRRVARAVVALWGVVTIVFVLMRLSGDPVPLLLPPDAPRSEVFRVRAELGLDQPLLVQYAVFLANVAHGDLGRSIHMRVPAMQLAAERLDATIQLAVASFVIAIAIALPAGLISALKRDTLWDHAVMGLALLGQAAPTFYIGIMLILILGLQFGLLPISGRGGWQNMVMPALTLGAFAMASIARLTRSAVLDISRTDFIRTARAKGLGEASILTRHNLKNAAIPIVTIMGLQFGTLLGGAVVTETVFSWPGIGRLAIQSIYNRDYPVVQAAVVLMACSVILVNFLVDLAYGWLDPRIRYR
jgi:ABC-type dipeptide/oligopeptide/nickel transport system permease component